jgi:hypothetical protein
VNFLVRPRLVLARHVVDNCRPAIVTHERRADDLRPQDFRDARPVDGPACRCRPSHAARIDEHEVVEQRHVAILAGMLKPPGLDLSFKARQIHVASDGALPCGMAPLGVQVPEGGTITRP